MTTLVWFWQDLRLKDNPALYQAIEQSDAVIPVFIWAPEEEGEWAPGGASKWWLHHSLEALQSDLRQHESRLILRQGKSMEVLLELIEETGAEAVYWNTRYVPALRQRDKDIEKQLRSENIDVATFASRLLHDPDAVRTTSDGPYHVYTPFWRKLEDTLEVAATLPMPSFDDAESPSSWPASLNLDDLDLLPEVDWAEGLREMWTPGEKHAHERLSHFLDTSLSDYGDERDRPDHDGTSTLSPHLCHGELSPRQVWNAVKTRIGDDTTESEAEAFLRQIIWRDFSYHLLHHYPETPTEPLKEKYNKFPWKENEEALTAWQKGLTGYPIVDAGMRQLWHTGWMHNRVRMIVASFLTKDLLIPWQEGAKWFWDTLVDADLANNTMGWQWAAGSGADAQPFFRIFNPISQGEKHDPDGAYVRRWVPELADLPDDYLHKPWEAPEDVLEEAGISLGEDYPRPIVDHAKAREAALEAYEKVR